jgi:TolB-like protein
MTKKCSLRLLGPFYLQNAAGQDITPNTQKWCALLAMLATAPNGRRSRKWLQDRLWSESNEQNGSVSLRQALFQIRRKLGVHEALLSSDKSVVHLELSQLDIDVLNVDHLAVNGAEVPQFLEGIDVEDFEFEDWLREQREYWFNNLNARYSNRQFQHNEPNGVAESAQSSSGLASDPLVLSPVVDAVIGRASNNQQKPKNFAVAVLPLVNLTEDPQLDFIADGFAEELIDGLSRLCWLPVISRYSTFAFRSRTPDLFAISDRLGSRYLVNGDLTKSGNELKVRVELNHMEDGSSVWASTFSLPGSLHSAVVNQALSEIVGKLDSSIDQYEQRMSVNPGYVASGYNENIWRGRWYLNKLTREDSIEARKYFDRALADNPEEPEALMQSAIWYLLQLWVNRGSVEDIQKVMPHLRKAQLANVSDSRGFTILGMAQLWMRNYKEAIDYFRKAIDLNPSSAKPHEQLGCCYYLTDNAKEAIPCLEEAIRLSPSDQHLFFPLGELAMSKLMVGELEESVECATQALVYRPNYWYPHLIRLEALQRLDRVDDYHYAKKSFERQQVKLGPRYFDWVPFEDKKWIEILKSHVGSGNH